MGRSTETVAWPRSGASYDAHSYHTKVPPQAIAELIRRHLPGGGVVADSFCGSGTTGVAAALAEAGLADPGRYDVLLGDLSPFAAFISEVLNSPPDPARFEREAREALRSAAEQMSAYWTAAHEDGREGTILYTVWSEVIACPSCAAAGRFWDLAVDVEQGEIRRVIECGCGASFRKDRAQKILETIDDPLLGTEVERPLRVPVRIVYEIDGERFERAPNADDLARIEAASRLAAPPSCPKVPMLNREGPWGDLYRAGYHKGISHVHHFYTWRSFVTVGRLWEAAARSALPQAVRFLVSSYNLSHSTLMSRLVFKRGRTQPVLTGYQTGTLYISSLPVEKNPFIGIERKKLPSVSRAFALTHRRRGSVEVVRGPAQAWSELDTEIDYAFVDPPFGANIPYAEANFIAEAWLGEFTDQLPEATISRAQEKAPRDYREALGESLSAVAGRLRRGGRMTVMFHSASSEPWEALVGALGDAGLRIDDTLLLDKRQGSFKQVRAEGGVQGDLLIEVQPAVPTARPRPQVADLATWLEAAMSGGEEFGIEQKRKLFSSYVAERLRDGGGVELSAADFYLAVDELAPGPVAAPAAG
jgi:hypothetical protein